MSEENEQPGPQGNGGGGEGGVGGSACTTLQKKKKKITSERQYHPEGIEGVKKTHPK